MTDNGVFKLQFADLIKRAKDKGDLVVKAAAVALQSSMVEKSPVDTGRFKGNFQTGIGQINDYAGAEPGADAVGITRMALDGWVPGKTIYLTNSLPYAQRLEYGWSQQAPAGMVRITVEEFPQKVAEIVAQVKT